VKPAEPIFQMRKANTMANGVTACTGLPGSQIAQNETIRHFQARLGSEAIRIGQACG
jgi:2-dehydropantoate 2-reductase